MSLVTTTRSQRSRIDLHSISTSVVLPEPTGPPTPTRSGGSFFVRPGIVCKAFIASVSRSEEARVLRLMLRREDGEHRRESLTLAVGEAHRVVDRLGNRCAQSLEDALACALPQRDRFQRGLHHVLGPAESKAQHRVANARTGLRCGER